MQPGLVSHLDAACDLRLQSYPGGLVPVSRFDDFAASRCHVPEPYLRTQRPDQRTRAVAASLGHEPQRRALERDGLWFDVQPEVTSGGMSQLDDEALRYRFLTLGKPVSGDRAQLLARLARVSTPARKMKLTELREECARLGLQEKPTKEEMVQDLERVTNAELFEHLSNDDLVFECGYRNLEVAGTREQLLARLKLYRHRPSDAY